MDVNSRKRWQRAALAAPIILVVTILTWFLYQTYARSVIIRNVERAGGTVSIDRGPLHPLLGPVSRTKLVSVAANGTLAADTVLNHASKLRRVDNLWILNTTVSEAGMQRLAAFGQLNLLSFQNVPITDELLAYVEGLSKLDCLLIANTDITPKGIESLKRALPNVHVLIADEMLKEQQATARSQSVLSPR